MSNILYSKRSLTRMFLVEILQNYRINPDNIMEYENLLKYFTSSMKEELDIDFKIDKDFCEELINIFVNNQERIKKTLSEKINKPILLDIVEDILMIAIAEILFTNTSFKIIANEYTTLCSCFSPSYLSLVSGVLNNIGKEISSINNTNTNL